MTVAPEPPALPPPPVPDRRPIWHERPGGSVVDEYAWLRDRDDPAVVAHLRAENAYTEAALAHLAPLRGRLFEEIRSRIQESDTSAPVPKDGWLYYTRTVEGQQYRLHCRRRGGTDAPEEVVLDQNELAEGHGYLQLGGFAVSPDHRLLAYSLDTTGAEVFTLRFRDLASGEDLADEIPRTSYGVAWANDAATVFYTVQDEAMRPFQLWRHELGGAAGDDALVLEEPDERFYLGVGRTRTDRFVVAALHSKVTSEVWVIDADAPTGAPRVVEPRRQGVEYHLDHHGDRFYLVTNDGGAENFKLVATPVDEPGRERWTEVVPHRHEVKLDDVDLFAEHLVLYERAGGLERIRVAPMVDGRPVVEAAHEIDQPEEVFSTWGAANAEFDTPSLRYSYTSLVTPPSVYEYDMDTRARTLVKRQPVLGGFDPDDYDTCREWATAPDGTRVPVSLVHRRGVAREGGNPLVLYGYGAYEHSVDPTFSPLRLSLLDRGVVFAIAHVRGGGELGRRWYEDGKLLGKMNTFADTVACAEHLVGEGWTSPERLALRGGSAGGLLVGAVLNARPDLFRAAVAEVPFVDLVTTMSDPTLPLTVIEWEEWGDPRDPTYAEYMAAYSPYDNVRDDVTYPDLLVTTGINDPRVGFWEPAKWVARLRERSPGSRVLFKCELGAGHGGPSGRYEAWHEEALVQAFLLDALGVADPVGGVSPGAPESP